MKCTSCVLLHHQVLHDSHYVLHHNDIIVFSSGQWIVPVITGIRPPPCAGFIVHTLHNNKGVMFGGTTIDETGIHSVDDLYTFSCTHNTIVS